MPMCPNCSDVEMIEDEDNTDYRMCPSCGYYEPN